jgi:hypothetical protein
VKVINIIVFYRRKSALPADTGGPGKNALANLVFCDVDAGYNQVPRIPALHGRSVAKFRRLFISA